MILSQAKANKGKDYYLLLGVNPNPQLIYGNDFELQNLGGSIVKRQDTGFKLQMFIMFLPPKATSY